MKKKELPLQQHYQISKYKILVCGDPYCCRVVDENLWQFKSNDNRFTKSSKIIFSAKRHCVDIIIGNIDCFTLRLEFTRSKIIAVVDFVISMLLIEEDYIMFHAGAICDSERRSANAQSVKIVCGSAGSGKTVRVLRESNFIVDDILSDDKILINVNLDIIALPRYLLLKYEDVIKKDIRAFCIRKITDYFKISVVDLVRKVLGLSYARRFFFRLFGNIKIPLQIKHKRNLISEVLLPDSMTKDTIDLLSIQTEEFLVMFEEILSDSPPIMFEYKYKKIINLNREICLKLKDL